MVFSVQDIQAFLAVARLGNVSKAAHDLGTTQPSVSRALQRMEAEMGISLFERGAHGARLTSNGQLFLESARAFLAHHTAMVRSATEMRAHSSGLLRLGITNSSSDSATVRTLSAMVKTRPGMRVSLVIGKSDALNEAVENGELDLAVVPSYPGYFFSCDQIKLADDYMRVVVRQGHPMLNGNSLRIADIADLNWVMPSPQSFARKAVSDVFERSGVAPPKVVVEVEYVSDAVMGLVTTTDMVALVPEVVIRSWLGRVQPLDIPSLTVRRSSLLLSRTGADWSPLMRDFRDVLTLCSTSHDSNEN